MGTEMKEIKKEEFDLLSKVLNWENIKCDFCKTKITRDNFGLLHADVLACNILFCQIKGLDKLEEIKGDGE